MMCSVCQNAERELNENELKKNEIKVVHRQYQSKELNDLVETICMMCENWRMKKKKNKTT